MTPGRIRLVKMRAAPTIRMIATPRTEKETVPLELRKIWFLQL